MKRFAIIVGIILGLVAGFLALFMTHWFLAIAIPVYLVVAFVEDARQRRRRSLEYKGYCLQCGYDLRASKVRCPECGTAVPPEVRETGRH